MPIIEYRDKKPKINSNVFIMNSATLIGDVVLNSSVLILSNAVLRGDFNQIYVGEKVCIQESSILNPVLQEPIRVEGHSIIGYGAKVHGGTIEKGVFLGTNSVVLQGVRIGENSLVAAGSILTANMIIPPRSLVAGVPAKIVRELRDEDIDWIAGAVLGYMEMLEDYKTELKKWEIRYTV
ncbi:MAG: gamma carbonic anhydrase family protein [Chloroflexota bacterium]|nr:gamma carbonic anhydrase family protein [Chloroflexota bacterium]